MTQIISILRITEPFKIVLILVLLVDREISSPEVYVEKLICAHKHQAITSLSHETENYDSFPFF